LIFGGSHRRQQDIGVPTTARPPNTSHSLSREMSEMVSALGAVFFIGPDSGQDA
jgi:hypothetical protein